MNMQIITSYLAVHSANNDFFLLYIKRIVSFRSEVSWIPILTDALGMIKKNNNKQMNKPNKYADKEIAEPQECKYAQQT